MKLRCFFVYRTFGGVRGFRRSRKVFLRNRDNDPGARFLPMPAIAVLYRRIEIDRVLGLQLEFLASNLDGQRSLQHIQQFHPGMLVRSQFVRRKRPGIRPQTRSSSVPSLCNPGTQKSTVLPACRAAPGSAPGPLSAPRSPPVCLRSSLKKYSSPTEYTIAIRNRVGSVGNSFPLSSFDNSAAESPVCLLSSTNPMPFFRRKVRSFSPIEYRPKPWEMSVRHPSHSFLIIKQMFIQINALRAYSNRTWVARLSQAGQAGEKATCPL